MLPCDYHLHTYLCRHAKGTPSDLAERAVALGIAEIGITEHAPMKREDWDDWHMAIGDLDLYLALIRQAQEDWPQLTIRCGLEVDYLPEHEDWIGELRDRHPWDYLIGSVHYVSDTFDFDNPAKRHRWEEEGVDRIWEESLDRLARAAASGLFQILGHVDLCKKFGHQPQSDMTSRFERLLETARDNRVAVEINTAGLCKPCREMYPSIDILSMASRLGVPLTFGSDAHHPRDVGMAFGEAVALARQAGYREYTQWERGESRSIRLPAC